MPQIGVWYPYIWQCRNPSNSKAIDLQCGYERAISPTINALSGA